MTEYDNNNSGALFRNEEKRDGRQDPDYRGQAEIDRVQYWVAAWLRTSKKGTKFMSLRFTPKQASEVKGGASNPPAQKVAPDDFDQNIPF